jgi:cytochrome c biogenesis protein
LHARLLQYRETFLRLFSDVLFAVSLFAIWGLLTLIGVIIDQGKDAAYYFATYPAPCARFILRLHWDTIYHGPAYLGIIGAILVSLAVCTFKRVIPARLPPLRAVSIEHIPLNARIDWTGSETDVRERLRSFLENHGWSIRMRSIDAVEWTFADKANWARRGVLVAHIGFVIIAAGTSIYWARGYSGDMTTMVGQTAVIPQTKATLHLEEFHYRVDPIQTKSGIIYQPIDYVSQLRVTDRTHTDQLMTLRVNHPLDLDGVAVYQAAYGVATQFRLTRAGKPIAGIADRALEEGQTITLPGTTRVLRYDRFVGTIGTSGLPTADPRPNRPGVILSILDDGTQSGTLLLPFDREADLGGGFLLTPIHTTFYTGFQYRYDPGIPLVGIGAFVLLAGLCISFYLLPARLYVRIDGQDTAWRVSLAASTVKGYVIFEEQFSALIRSLRSVSTVNE